MKMWTLTEERAAKLMEELEKLKELWPGEHSETTTHTRDFNR